jgi:steroid delta-isomerase-like uncharacterized protein
MTQATRDVEREYRELWNGNFSKLDVVAESVDVSVPSMSDGEMYGRDESEAYLRELRAGSPDWHVTVNDVLASDELVMKEWTVTATHEGEYNGMPPTNREIEISGMAKIRTEDGKVQEDRLYYDLRALFEQLGLMTSFSPQTARFPPNRATDPLAWDLKVRRATAPGSAMHPLLLSLSRSRSGGFVARHSRFRSDFRDSEVLGCFMSLPFRRVSGHSNRSFPPIEPSAGRLSVRDSRPPLGLRPRDGILSLSKDRRVRSTRC